MPNFPQLLPLLFFLLIPAVIGLILLLGWQAERKRVEAFRLAADDLGFEFHPTGDPVLQSWLSNFELFSQGHSRKFRNVMRGRTEDLDVAVFDYQYTTGHGKNARTWRTTVVCLRAAGLGVPDFRLRPETFWHRVGTALFGYQDIDFDSHPTFSAAFLLKGPDEEAVRAAFTPAVLEHFEQLPGVSVEGSGDTLVYYRPERRVGPDRVRDLMAEGFAALGLFRRPGGPAG
jgi:hypothetical protein